MKKIITALTVTVMAIGSVFAQVKLTYTSGTYLYGLDHSKIQDLGYKAAEDNLEISAKNSNGGVKLIFKPSVGKDEKIANSGKFSNYTGWVNFGSGLFKFQSGVWDERSANRFTGNAGKWDGAHYEKYKLGVANGMVAKDVNHISSVNGATALTSMLAYTGDAFNAKVSIIKNAYGTLDLQSGFAFEVGTTIGEGTKIIADLKTTKVDEIAFAAFVENTTLKENLDFLVGFSYGKRGDVDGIAKADSIEWAIDIRGKYALTDSVNLTTMNNLSYLATDKSYVNPLDATAVAPVFNIWNMVSLDTKITDKLLAMFTVEWEYKDLFHEATKTKTSQFGNLDLIPSVKFTPGKGCNVSTGLIIHTEGWSRPNTSTFAIPVLLNVSL